MYTVNLRKIESTHENLRTDTVVGLAPNLPQRGKQSFMYSEPLNKESDLRYIHTSIVKKVKFTENGSIVLWTQNSIYELTNITKETYNGK